MAHQAQGQGFGALGLIYAPVVRMEVDGDETQAEIQRILARISLLRFTHAVHEIHLQSQNIPWRWLEEHLTIREMGVDVVKKMYQWYDASMMRLERDVGNVTAIGVWRVFVTTFTRDWLEPNGLTWRKGDVLLTDMLSVFNAHGGHSNQKYAWFVEQKLKSIIDEMNPYKNGQSAYVRPQTYPIWEPKFVALADALSDDGHLTIRQYMKAAHKSRFLYWKLRDAGEWDDNLCNSGKIVARQAAPVADARPVASTEENLAAAAARVRNMVAVAQRTCTVTEIAYRVAADRARVLQARDHGSDWADAIAEASHLETALGLHRVTLGSHQATLARVEQEQRDHMAV